MVLNTILVSEYFTSCFLLKVISLRVPRYDICGYDIKKGWVAMQVYANDRPGCL